MNDHEKSALLLVNNRLMHLLNDIHDITKEKLCLEYGTSYRTTEHVEYVIDAFYRLAYEEKLCLLMHATKHIITSEIKNTTAKNMLLSDVKNLLAKVNDYLGSE
jgi:hypothetical protein